MLADRWLSLESVHVVFLCVLTSLADQRSHTEEWWGILQLNQGWHHTVLCNAVISTFLTMNNFSQSHFLSQLQQNYIKNVNTWDHSTTYEWIERDGAPCGSIAHACMRLRNAYTLIRK